MLLIKVFCSLSMTIQGSEPVAKLNEKFLLKAIILIALALVLVTFFVSLLFLPREFHSPSPSPSNSQSLLCPTQSPAGTPSSIVGTSIITSTPNPIPAYTPKPDPSANQEPEEYSTATAFREHLVIRNMNDNSTYLQVMNLDTLVGKFAKVGSQFSIEIPDHNEGDGLLNIVNIACNTTGFSLLGVSPALPVTLPNTVSVESGNVTLRISFLVPKEQYVGPFDFTVFYEYNPTPVHYNNFTSFIENLQYSVN
jgi:hypothetical protein